MNTPGNIIITNEQIRLVLRPQIPPQVPQPRAGQPAPALQHLPGHLLGPCADSLRVHLSLSSHTFCYICIENWASSQKSCPLCKSPFRRKLEKDLIALNIIDDLDAACVHPNCQWTGSYAHVKRHQRLCVHRPRKPQEEVL